MLVCLKRNNYHLCTYDNYRIAGMFGGDKVWRIASSKVVGKKSLANAYSSVAWLIMKWTDE